MYVIKFENQTKPYHAFFKPYTAVRDGETYSMTYLSTSIINGIEDFCELDFGTIKRHKLSFYEGCMDKEFIPYKAPNLNKQGIHIKHILINPVLYFGFDNKEDAINMTKHVIYGGQMEYMIYPSCDYGIKEMTEEEFDKIEGTETFKSNEVDGVFCGFNRFDNNSKIYIEIKRTYNDKSEI